jgi:integrase
MRCGRHFGLARAYSLSADIAKSRSAYQDFFALWKDADRSSISGRNQTPTKELRAQLVTSPSCSKPRQSTRNCNNDAWHDLQHTFISRLVMAGVDLRRVQELAGHKTIAMTRRYAHLAPAHLQAAVEKLVESTATCTATGASKEENAESANIQ